MHVRKLMSSELPWANSCYSDADFIHSSESDFIAVAELDGTKAGLGRVVPIDFDIGELGGMYVLPEFRGKSLAASLVDFLVINSGYSTLFCIPFAHLELFYTQHGFVPINDSVQVPQAIAEKLTWCQQHYAAPVRLLFQAKPLSMPNPVINPGPTATVHQTP